jgi:hypothetical protein
VPDIDILNECWILDSGLLHNGRYEYFRRKTLSLIMTTLFERWIMFSFVCSTSACRWGLLRVILNLEWIPSLLKERKQCNDSRHAILSWRTVGVATSTMKCDVRCLRARIFSEHPNIQNIRIAPDPAGPTVLVLIIHMYIAKPFFQPSDTLFAGSFPAVWHTFRRVIIPHAVTGDIRTRLTLPYGVLSTWLEKAVWRTRLSIRQTSQRRTRVYGENNSAKNVIPRSHQSILSVRINDELTWWLVGPKFASLVGFYLFICGYVLSGTPRNRKF